ncbi:MAG: hypothetical protein J6Q89_00080 [Clostridia bacterium]|nr:hypothetical protein [Clostridia bacterium]
MMKSPVIKSVVFVVAALLIGTMITCLTLVFYNNHVGKLDRDEVTDIELKIDDDGTFSGKFRSEVKGKRITGIDYEVEDGNVYITILATSGTKHALTINEDGYAAVQIKDLTDVKKFYYRSSAKDEELTVHKG